MKTASFKTTKSEIKLIHQIIARADKLGLIMPNYDRLTCDMDITACHVNGCELNLEALLAFPDHDFMHDVAGIALHIDRQDGFYIYRIN